MNLMKVTFSGILSLGDDWIHYFSLLGVNFSLLKVNFDFPEINLGCSEILEIILVDFPFMVMAITECYFATDFRNGLTRQTGLFTARLHD